jgi:hypothetical protein
LDDFHQTLFQMVAFRSLGARILPSLLSILPQTEIYRRWAEPSKLEFCPYLFPEFVVTGHEIYRSGRVELPERHRGHFDLIRRHPDIFSGFFHLDLQGNVLPKLRLLQQFGFDRRFDSEPADAESCGAHSPHVAPFELQISGSISWTRLMSIAQVWLARLRTETGAAFTAAAGDEHLMEDWYQKQPAKPGGPARSYGTSCRDLLDELVRLKLTTVATRGVELSFRTRPCTLYSRREKATSSEEPFCETPHSCSDRSVAGSSGDAAGGGRDAAAGGQAQRAVHRD